MRAFRLFVVVLVYPLERSRKGRLERKHYTREWCVLAASEEAALLRAQAQRVVPDPANEWIVLPADEEDLHEAPIESRPPAWVESMRQRVLSLRLLRERAAYAERERARLESEEGLP